MKNISTIAFLLLSLTIYGQKHYKVSWGMEPYDTLEQFTSIDLLRSPMGIDTVLQLGFEMPVYDTFFTEVGLDLWGYGDFRAGNKYYADLYFFAADFAPFYPMLNLYKSDWRYEQTMVNELKVLKVEWRNMALLDEIFRDTVADHYVNFQVWFFENGNIELHIGEMKLDETKFFSDTSGFMFNDGDTYGPWVGITDSNYKEVYYVSGPDSALREGNNEDSSDIIYGVPPVGRYYRFEKQKVSSINNNRQTVDFAIYPNPARGSVCLVAGQGGFAEIIAQTGAVIKWFNLNAGNNTIDLEVVQKGFYFVKFTDMAGNSKIEKLLVR